MLKVILKKQSAPRQMDQELAAPSGVDAMGVKDHRTGYGALRARLKGRSSARDHVFSRADGLKMRSNLHVCASCSVGVSGEQRQKPPCEGFIMVLSSKTFAKGKSWGAKGLRKVRESCALYGVCERARERF